MVMVVVFLLQEAKEGNPIWSKSEKGKKAAAVMADTDPTPKVVVVEVVKNSPAHRAGLNGYVIHLYVCMYVFMYVLNNLVRFCTTKIFLII